MSPLVELKKNILKHDYFQKKLLSIPFEVRSYNPVLFTVQHLTADWGL